MKTANTKQSRVAASLRLLPAIALLLIATMAAVAANKQKWADQARQRKADYLYLEAQNRDVEGDRDAAYELTREAYRLNPADKSVGYDLGVYELQLAGRDTVAIDKAGQLLTAYYNDHPEDYYSAYTYGQLLEFRGRDREALDLWRDLHNRFPANPQVTFKYSNTLAATRDTANVRLAAALIDTIMDNEGFSSELYMRKMQLLYYTGDTPHMIQETSDLVSTPSGMTVDNYVLAGNVFTALNQPDRALEYFKKACETDSTSGLAFYSLANFYRQIGDSVGYENEVFEALRRTSLDPEVKEGMLGEYISSHIADTLMHPRIEKLFAILVDAHPHDSGVRNAYANYLAYKQRYEDAAEQVTYALDIDPSQNDRWETLAQLYQLAGDYDKSISAVDNAMHYFPDSPSLYYLKGLDYQLLDDMPNALEMMKKARDLTPQNDGKLLSNLACAMGDISYKMGDEEGAFGYYDESLDIDPENALTLNNYAYFLSLSERDLDKAQRMVEEALVLSPDNINAVDTYAWVLFKKKEYQRAREVFDSALEQILADEDVSAEAYEHAGDIYFMTGDADTAVDFWNKAYKLDPDNQLLKKKVTLKTYFYK